MTIGAKPEPEIERRRRQLEVITKKIERAQVRNADAGVKAGAVAYEATEARIRELEAEGPDEQPRRRSRREA